MKCENCLIEHDGSYASGRFCNKKCSRSFSTKIKRKDINEKVSKTLKSKIDVNGLTSQQRKDNYALKAKKLKDKIILSSSILDLSSRTVAKIIKRMQLPCSLCGWYEEGVSGDIHHIKEQKNGGSNEHSNLTYICPNCHRKAHSNKIDSTKFISLETYVGNKWKEFYFIK